MSTTQREARDTLAIAIIDREHQALTEGNAQLTELGRQAQAHLDAAAACAKRMAAVIDGEAVHEKLNRRDLPGITIRNYAKDIRPWLQEYLAWHLGATVISDFKVFQSDRPFEEVVKRDTMIINDEANALKVRVQRGF